MYVTIPRRHREHTITFDDLINGLAPEVMKNTKDTADTTTYWCNSTLPKTDAKFDFFDMYATIRNFNAKYANLIEVEDKSTLYG